jgi:hypothetical protein
MNLLSMKRKIFLYLIFAAAAGMGACTEKMPHTYDLSPDERAQAQLAEYQQILCSAPYGWLVTVGSQNLDVAGGAYRFWMKFSPNNRVTMFADVDSTTATVPKESSYRMKQMQYPTLMFDTYSYIHLPDDPDAPIPNASAGLGLLSDSDVSLMGDISGDEFRAVGRKRLCPFIFTRATLDDSLAVARGNLVTVKETVAARWEDVKYPTVRPTPKLLLQMTVGKRLSSFTYADENNEVQTVFIPSYAELDENNIRLVTPFKYKDVEFERITWDGTNHTVIINGEPYLVYDPRQPSYPLSFGPGKTYNTLTVDRSKLNVSGVNVIVSPFLNTYNDMVTAASAEAVTVSNFTLIFELNDMYEEQMRLSVAFSKEQKARTGEAMFKVNRNRTKDTMYFTSYRPLTTANGKNMDSICHLMSGNLLSYLLYERLGTDSVGVNGKKAVINPSGNKFTVDWQTNTVPKLTGNLGRLIMVGNPSNYMPGILGKQED